MLKIRKIFLLNKSCSALTNNKNEEKKDNNTKSAIQNNIILVEYIISKMSNFEKLFCVKKNYEKNPQKSKKYLPFWLKNLYNVFLAKLISSYLF